MAAWRLNGFRARVTVVRGYTLRRSTVIRTRLRGADTHKGSQDGNRHQANDPARANAVEYSSPRWLGAAVSLSYLQSKHAKLVQHCDPFAIVLATPRVHLDLEVNFVGNGCDRRLPRALIEPIFHPAISSVS